MRIKSINNKVNDPCLCESPNPCSTCESYIDGNCVSNCLFCESCVNGQCVSNCDVCAECTINGCQAKDCPPCHTCVNGICVYPCLSCETCDANEQCVSNCGPCEQCTSTGCVSACGPCETCVNGVCMPKVCGECETCVNGVCTSNCDTLCENCVSGVCTPFVTCGDCEECIGGNCAYKCTGCETCVNGQCVSNCPNCYECENGVCVEKCTGLGCPTGCETINPITGECALGYNIPTCNCQTWGDCGQQGGIGAIRSDASSSSGYCKEYECANGGFPCQRYINGVESVTCLNNCTTLNNFTFIGNGCINCGGSVTGFQNCVPSVVNIYSPDLNYCREDCDCVAGYKCELRGTPPGDSSIRSADPTQNECVPRKGNTFPDGKPVVYNCSGDTCWECNDARLTNGGATTVGTSREAYSSLCTQYYKNSYTFNDWGSPQGNDGIFGSKPFCKYEQGKTLGMCVECMNDLQCPTGSICSGNTCICTTDSCCVKKFGPYYYFAPASAECQYNPDA